MSRLQTRIDALPFAGDAGDLLQALADLPGIALLDGGAGGAEGRVSILGVAPLEVIDSWAPLRPGEPDPFQRVQRALDRHATEADPRWPFTGGWIGWLGYDLRLLIEELPDRHPRVSPLPDLHLAEYRVVVLRDEHRGECFLARTLDRHDSEGNALVAEAAAAVRSRIAGWRPGPDDPPAARGRVHVPPRADYVAAVRRAKEHIAAGDIYQVNLSLRVEALRPTDPIAFYRRLRRRNPAAFGGYLAIGGEALLSVSPERFLRLDGRRVETRPIKGTAPRHTDPAQDARAARDLQDSPKDRAELAMIVDVLRNDLSRVCLPGTVRVRDAMALESHPTVHHLVATIEGELEDRRRVCDLLRATLPGGSITGAPRIRAMEIIDDLEPCRRGLYTGSLGYLGYDGRMDLNILIRSAVTSGELLLIHGGCGIVADSDPDAEYREALHKLRGFLDVLGVSDESD